MSSLGGISTTIAGWWTVLRLILGCVQCHDLVRHYQLTIPISRLSSFHCVNLQAFMPRFWSVLAMRIHCRSGWPAP